MTCPSAMAIRSRGVDDRTVTLSPTAGAYRRPTGSRLFAALSETAPRRSASLASLARRCVCRGTPNLSYRLARCCLTAAWVMTSSSAIARVDAGSVNMSRSSSGRHSATQHVALAGGQRGGASSTSVAAPAAPSGSRNTAGSGRRGSRRRVATAARPRYARRSPRCRWRNRGRSRTSRRGNVRAPRAGGWRSRRRRRDVVLGGLADRRAVRRELEAPAAGRRRSPRSAATRRQVYETRIRA